MKVYYDIKDMLERELEQISNKRELTSNNLEIMYKVVDIIKDIETICAMKEAEEDGYSGRMPYYMHDGMEYSGARGRGRYARRDSLGRYSRESGYSGADMYDGGSYAGRSYDGGSYDSYARGRRGYSREDSKEYMVSELERMEKEAADEQQKMMIRNWKNQLKNA